MEAVEDFRYIVSEEPEYLLAHDQLARAHLLAGDEKLAITHFKKALALKPGFRPSLAALVDRPKQSRSHTSGLALMEAWASSHQISGASRSARIAMPNSTSKVSKRLKRLTTSI